MSVQFCPKCDAMLSPDVTQCSQCGTAIRAEVQPLKKATSGDAISASEFWALVRTVLVPILGLVLGFIVLIVLIVVVLT